MRPLLFLVLGLGAGYGLALLTHPSAEPSAAIPRSGSEGARQREMDPALAPDAGNHVHLAPPSFRRPDVPVALPPPAQPEGSTSSEPRGTSPRMQAYWQAYREAMERLAEMERALLPEDYRRELPATAEEIEKEGRWYSLTRVFRELRDQDIGRYMRWRSQRAAEKLVERYPQLATWARSQIADAYQRFFDEEGRRFLSERPSWEAATLSAEERGTLFMKYRNAYEDRLHAVNTSAAGLLMKQLPDVDWARESFTFPVP